MLDSLSLGPAIAHAPNGRTSALALYFQLMDKLTPLVLTSLGRQTHASRAQPDHEAWWLIAPGATKSGGHLFGRRRNDSLRGASG